MRGKASIETTKRDREAIVITEIPYQVNKAAMVERIAELVRDKRIEGVSDLRDESDRDGMRVVIELKRDASSDVTLNQLFRYTPLQTSFGVNMLALNRGQARADGPAEAPRPVPGVPRRSRSPAHQVRAVQGPKPRPRAGRPGDRGRQYRRGHRPDPQLRQRQRGARAIVRQGLACRRHDRADRPDPGPPDRAAGRRPDPPVRRAGPRHPGPDPVPPHRPRPR